MAKRKGWDTSRIALTDSAISLFDRENLEFLDALRYSVPAAPATTAPGYGPSDAATAVSGLGSAAAPGTETLDADRLFDEFKIADNDEARDMGELNVQIIHRGRIRISRSQWRQVIATCSDGCTEDGVRKDFHLNILQHPCGVRLIYISYRYKQSGEKQKEARRGILVDTNTDIQQLMMHLAYWFTAQPHAERNYPVWKKLVDEAMTKIKAAA